MPIVAIIFILIAIVLLLKKGFKTAVLFWFSPCAVLLLLLGYNNKISDIVSEVIGINIIGIVISIAWCAILKKFSSKNTYLYLGIIPSLLFFGFFVVLPVIVN